jgi:hypothetical protein
MTIGPVYHGYPTSQLVGGAGITISSGFGNDTTISVDLKNNKDFQELSSKIEAIEARLAILVPNMELQERFAALQEAYNHYKLIEKLVNDQIKQT